nr:efflux RND transporter periplasmic adaptor subunit [uncultured Carboxylicivirga sp.]
MKTTIYILLTALFISSCNHQKTDETTTENNLIEISKQQFEAEQMQLGEIHHMAFPNQLHFTGYIKPNTNGWAKVGLPLEGIVQQIKVNIGQDVKKGDPLFVIGGNHFIDLQKDYAESSARLNQLKVDYDRVGLLYKENIGTEKEYVTAKSSYESELAMNNALRMKLENIGLNVDKIAKGSLYTSFTITAPIKGFLTDIKATVGEFIDQQEDLASIVDSEQLRLQIIVFEKDISSVQKGQKVEFHASGNNKDKASAIIDYVGKTVNPQSKSIECYAKIEPEYLNKYINNQFVEGEIILSSDTVAALPIDAVIQADDQSYVLVLENETDSSYLFQNVLLQTGRSTSDSIEITNTIRSGTIVTRGVYNIMIE